MVGIALAINNIAFALSQIPGGYLADSIGRKRLVVLMTWLIALVNFMVAIAPTWHVLLLIAVFDGIVRVYIPALRALLQDSLSNSIRARGLILSNLLPSFIAIPAPWIGGYIISSIFTNSVMGYRVVFLVALALSLVAAILRTKLRETYRSIKTMNLKTIIHELIRSYTQLVHYWNLMNKKVRKALIISMLIAIAQGIYMPYLIRIATARAGFSDMEWGFILSISLIISTLISLLLMPIVDKIERRELVFIGSITLSLGLYLFYNYASLMILDTIVRMLYRSLSLYGLVLGLSLMFIGFNMINGGYTSFIIEVTSLGLRGRLMALDNIVFALGTAIGGFIASLIYTAIYEEILIICLGMTLIYGITSVFLMRKEKLTYT